DVSEKERDRTKAVFPKRGLRSRKMVSKIVARVSVPKSIRGGHIYDMVAVKGINFRVPILDVGTGLPLGGSVLGGISGTDLLVSALVLLLPSTRPSTQLGNLLRSAQKKQAISLEYQAISPFEFYSHQQLVLSGCYNLSPFVIRFLNEEGVSNFLRDTKLLLFGIVNEPYGEKESIVYIVSSGRMFVGTCHTAKMVRTIIVRKDYLFHVNKY
ncbi:40S ribosomal protein S11-2-like protein, partial [Tanacetum coccineum]